MSSSKYILIVDDDQDLLEMYDELFKMEGFEILTARSAANAIEICKKHKDIQVIISDSNMPEMSGMELLINLRSYYKTMPVFYLLTGGMEMEEDELKKNGGHALILKPFDLDEIMRRIINDLK